MDGLIEDLLTLAQTRYEATELRPVSVAEVAGDCWETVPTAAAELTIDLTQTIRAEREQLKRLFETLFTNAVEHGSRDGTVTVGQVDGGFYIADEGPGIPAEERSEIFTAGYSTADDGTGFGLQIVENIVATHGCDIDVTDSDTGGARFEITGVDTVE